METTDAVAVTGDEVGMVVEDTCGTEIVVGTDAVVPRRINVFN